MKSTLTTLLILAHLIVGVLRPEAPKAIQIVGPSEAEIKEQVRNEQRTKAFAVATRTVARLLAANCQPGSARFAGIIAGSALGGGLSPKLVAAVVVVESSCNPNADDHLGSVGLMQVNSKTWHRSVASLRDPAANVRIGTQVLAGYIHKFGVEEGLHHYNGFSDNHGHVYVKKVLEVASGKNIQAAN